MSRYKNGVYYDQNVQKLLTKGYFNFQGENYIQAKVALEKALALEPFDPHIYYYLGIIYGKLIREPTLAITFFDKAIDLDPNYYSAYFQKAQLLQGRLNQYSTALATLDKAIITDPEVSNAYILKGIIYTKQNMLLEAKKNFQLALGKRISYNYLNRERRLSIS